MRAPLRAQTPAPEGNIRLLREVSAGPVATGLVWPYERSTSIRAAGRNGIPGRAPFYALRVCPVRLPDDFVIWFHQLDTVAERIVNVNAGVTLERLVIANWNVGRL